MYWREFPQGHFSVIFASPPCTESSRAKTIESRNIALADRVVKKTLEMIPYFRPEQWFVEKPRAGMLKYGKYMGGIPYVDVDNCKFLEFLIP